jgi:hypothetical protein
MDLEETKARNDFAGEFNRQTHRLVREDVTYGLRQQEFSYNSVWANYWEDSSRKLQGHDFLACIRVLLLPSWAG